jgi:hypothetical protein
LSYVTGSHSAKVGVYNVTVSRDSTVPDNYAKLTYRTNTPLERLQQGLNPRPNQLTERATPLDRSERQRWDLGIYAQDKWTVQRWTISGGIRFDMFQSYFPEQTLGPGPHVPNRNITFPKTEMANWKDVVPRMGASYDVFGNGRTAFKISLNKYVTAQGLQGTYGDTANPVNRMANIVTRTWTDADSDFVPDCDLTNVLAQDLRASGGDFCGVVSDTNFGRNTVSLNYDPEVLTGWFTRPFQWEFSTSVQHQIVPRVSVDVGYFRRWYGNFGVTDNLTLAPSDFGTYGIAIPVDPRLPDGGGGSVSGFMDVNPDKAALPQNNYFTLARKYGKQIDHWNGVDLTVSARIRAGMTVSGGISTGRRLTDVCDIVDDVPEASYTGSPTAPSLHGRPYCRQPENFLTDGKLIWTYGIPKIDVSVSGLFISRPGPQISANRVVPNAEIAPSLGRPLSNNAPNATINMVYPGTMFGDRRNQLDLRFTKPFRMGGTRLGVNFEVYNVFNANAVLTENATYTNASINGWRVPTSIVPPRFVKFSVQMDF